MSLSTVSSRERVTQAIGFHETDQVPTGEIAITEGIVRTLLGISQVGFAERAECATRLGIDAVCVPPEWPITSSGLPSPSAVGWADVEKWATQTHRYVFAMLNGAFNWGMNLMGFEAFLAASLKRSRNLIDLIREVEDLNISLADCAVSAGANGILIADDIAYQRGTTVSPQVLRDLFFPSLARQVRKIAVLGAPVFFHSDGNLNGVIEDLVDIGFHGLQGLEAAAGMDLDRVKASYGEKVCLWGNLDPEDLFLPRPPEELNRKTAEIVSAAAPGGGFIFGTSSGLVDGMRMENIEAVYRAVRFRESESKE
jgi:uroporphyrinogen decarboxylase